MLLRSGTDLPEGCISDMVFDSLQAGELAQAQQGALSQHVGSCQACSVRQKALQQAAQGFLARSDRAARLARLSAGVERRSRVRWQLHGTLAAAAALLLVLFVEASHPRSEVRRKGAGLVGFYVRRGGSISRGQSGQRVQPGDQLRFTFRSDRPAYLAILSLDAKHVISTYYPRPGVQRQLVPSGGEIELPSAVELDTTLGRERVFAISCAEPPEVELLRRALAEGAKLKAPPDCELEQFELYKEPPS